MALMDILKSKVKQVNEDLVGGLIKMYACLIFAISHFTNKKFKGEFRKDFRLQIHIMCPGDF